ncbi:MAG: tape measure protein, partial [Hyphomicrobiales bacterium]|nr:tape measure protein [Hyphomicrobiales bacterium]
MADDIIPVGIKFTTTGLEAASAGLDKIAAAGPKVQAATDQIEAGAKKTGRSLEDLGGSAASASSPLERFAGSAVKAGAAYAALQVSSEILRSFYDLSRAVTTVQADLDKFRVAFEISGTAAQAVREFQFVKDAAKDLGLNFASAADGYRKFALAARDTAIEGDKARAIFTAVSKASSVMGLSAEESQGVFLALGQMISKGTVQAEELRGQLGERLPGAFQIASRAMGVTTAEMGKLLETGQVLADDFLPKFGAQLEKELGKKAADSANTAQGAINQLDSAWAQLKQTFAQTGAGDAAAGQLRILADGITGIDQAMQASRATGDGWFGQMTAGFGSLLGFLNPLNGLSYSVRDLNKQMEEGNKILANPKSGMYQRSSAAADVADAGEKLSKINSLLPYPDAFERGSTAEAAKQAAEMQAAATRMSASVKAFVGAKENLSTADQKLEKQTALLNKFAAAVKGVDNNSALFAEAQKALSVGLGKIDKDFEKKLNPGASGAASKAKADAEAYASVIAQSEKRNALLAAEVEARRPLTALEKLSIELKEKEEELSRKHGTSQLAEVQALNEKAKALAAAIELQKGFAEARASELAAAVAVDAARKSTVDSLLGEAEAVEAQVKALRQETQAIGVTGVALALLTNKRVD